MGVVGEATLSGVEINFLDCNEILLLKKNGRQVGFGWEIKVEDGVEKSDDDIDNAMNEFCCVCFCSYTASLCIYVMCVCMSREKKNKL